jgi:hypothetical protein
MVYKMHVVILFEKDVIYFFGPVLDPDLVMNGEENNSENGSLQELLVQEEV